MKKYLITILCNDTQPDYYNDIYVDTIPTLFDTREECEKVLHKQLYDECQSLNEDTDDSVLFVPTKDNKIVYELDINGIYVPQYWVSQYNIIELEIN